MIDTHAHLNNPMLYENRAQLIEQAKQNNVNVIVNIGSDMQSSQKAVEIANQFKPAYAVVGFHPHEAKFYHEQQEQNLFELVKQNKKVVAIGEIGLDYFYNFSSPEVQKQVFERQIKLADKLGLPIVLHSRNATKDMLEILQKNKQCLNNGGIIHCFGEDYAVAQEFISLGFLLGIGGMITFKNAEVLRQTVKQVGLENIVLETDCPYLAPHPYRGKLNKPAYIKQICDYIAQLLGVSSQQVAQQTTKNAKRVYRI